MYNGYALQYQSNPFRFICLCVCLEIENYGTQRSQSSKACRTVIFQYNFSRACGLNSIMHYKFSELTFNDLQQLMEETDKSRL
jgi:hypothetical protein